MKRSVFTMILGLALATATLAAGIPEEGVVLNAGDHLLVLRGRTLVTTSKLLEGSTPMVTMKEMVDSGRKPNYVHAERQRAHLRDKDLGGSQFRTLLKGGLVEGAYGKGRDHAEKSKANAQQGRGSKSLLKGILGGLFK